VAANALELGAEIINDPTGMTFDPLLAKVVVRYDAGLILNHMRGTPETWAKLPPLPDVMGAILHDLEASVHRALRAGIERSRLVIDPGLGFGKRGEQNSEILARLGELTRLYLPILVGPSRKSFLAQSAERETQFATASAVAAAILGGAHLVRVHDVPQMRAAASVADAIARAGAAE
jgi:dihydropteroate synthase